MVASDPAADEGLGRAGRLRRRAEFQRCYRDGRRRYGRLMTLFVLVDRERSSRIGITASRKLGGSVTRHRAKRRIKEIYRRWPGRRHLPGGDLVVHLKPAAGVASFTALRSDLLRLLNSTGRGARR